MSTLTIQLPGQLPVFHVLKDETITIGRMKGNTIVIEDSSISLMHAKITRKNDEFYLKDLNSTNGTLVNGQPITEARLSDFDRVKFADVPGQFLAESGVLAPQPAAKPVMENPVRPVAPPAVPVIAQRRTRSTISLPLVTACLGGITGFLVICVFAWRFFHLNETGTQQSLKPATLVANRVDAVENARPVVAAKPNLEPKSQGSPPEPVVETAAQLGAAL